MVLKSGRAFTGLKSATQLWFVARVRHLTSESALLRAVSQSGSSIREFHTQCTAICLCLKTRPWCSKQAFSWSLFMPIGRNANVFGAWILFRSTVLGREGIAWVTQADSSAHSLYPSSPAWQSGVPSFPLKQQVNPEKGLNCRDLPYVTNSFCLLDIRLNHCVDTFSGCIQISIR